MLMPPLYGHFQLHMSLQIINELGLKIIHNV